jgi:hypothetical protein
MKGLVLIAIIIGSTIPLGLAEDSTIKQNALNHVNNTTFINRNQFQNDQRTIGPWTLICETRKFPNRAIARNHLKNQQFEIQNCYAEQTVHNNTDEKLVTATLKITPARIFFETKNVMDRHKHAKLIIGEQQKRYSLYTNCYNYANTQTCLLFPEGKEINRAIVSEMKNNNQFQIKLIDSETHAPILLTFDLNQFTEIYPVIEETYRKMEEILQRYSESFILNEQWLV